MNYLINRTDYMEELRGCLFEEERMGKTKTNVKLI